MAGGGGQQHLVGGRADCAVLEQAADLVLEGARGQGGNDFEIALLRRTLVATLRDATEA